MLRFPCIVQNSITVLVWWLVLVPAIYFTLPKAGSKTGQEGSSGVGPRRAFAKFNCSPFLINVHLLNLPLALCDSLLRPRLLTPADLWIGFAFGMVYCLFYLLCLDRNGIHFYIILSPRTKLCFLSYGTILALYYGVFLGYNSLVHAFVLAP